MRPIRLMCAALLLLALVAAWAVPAQHIRLLALREAYRAGEALGITVAAAHGGRLAGQVMGFNYAQPPAWYEFTAHAFSGACAGAPVLLACIWLWPLLSGRRGRVPASPRSAIPRGAAALCAAGLVFSVLYTSLRWWLWEQGLALFEGLGGSVARLSGQVGMGARGPFYGDTLADDLGNAFSRYGADIVFGAAACAAGLIVHTLLIRRAASRARAAGLCPSCGYTLRGLPPGAPCPECGGKG